MSKKFLKLGGVLEKTRQNPELHLKVGESIKSLREQKGLSQAELSRRMGYHTAYICLAEKGERRFTLVTLVNVSRVLGVELSEILDFE
jgi:transcriptional regulator with XRE-family HTH domain